MRATGSGLAGRQSLGEGPSSLAQSDRAFWVGLSVVILSLVSALATYLILTGLTPIVPSDETVVTVLFFNVILILAMIAVIAWQVVGLIKAWREKEAGARLHVRIVALFSIIAALPALLLAVAATTTFSRSLDGWFSTRTRAIIDNSLNVARAYMDEHGQVIRTDVMNMAKDIDGAADLVQNDAAQIQQFVMVQAGLRDLPSAHIINNNGQSVVAGLDDEKIPYTAPPDAVLKEAEAGQVPIMASEGTNRIAAVVKLERFPGQYLYVARGISPKVMGHLQRTEQSVSEYNRLRAARGGLTLAHGLMYLMISMTALLAAIWSGLWFAGRFVAPIRRLIGAAEDVSRGDLDVELPERRGEGDLRRLSMTFNNMTRELKSQRDALVTANSQLLERRQFMEAVLSGVSAGVIGIDSQQRITLVSRSAEKLLGIEQGDVVGKPILEAIPAFAEVLTPESTHGVKSRRPDQLTMTVGQDERTFAVRITGESSGEGDAGSVVTFDDITELVVAQRTSAWADVARRIAHEIKNPLTPIQLSAERLRRKYGRVITDDRETFDNLTHTIERQVGDIKSMVDEFASFARMPKPEMAPQDLRDAVREPVILFRESNPDITYEAKLPETPVILSFDRRLISQGLTNLIKNASEAVQQAGQGGERPKSWRGRVEASMKLAPGRVMIEVTDNGTGLPKQNRARLLEPYVTTKGAKGTGLGLAIVQKIVEQHGGTLTLEDAPPAPDRPAGALVRITLPMPLTTDAVSSNLPVSNPA